MSEYRLKVKRNLQTHAVQTPLRAEIKRIPDGLVYYEHGQIAGSVTLQVCVPDPGAPGTIQANEINAPGFRKIGKKWIDVPIVFEDE